MGDGDPGAEAVRRILLEYSDHQAVRNVFGQHTGRETASLRDHVEALRATEGRLAIVADDGAAEVYARWDGTGGRYEYLVIWPPWTVGGYEHTDGEGLAEVLEGADAIDPTAHDLTPFADERALAGLSDEEFR